MNFFGDASLIGQIAWCIRWMAIYFDASLKLSLWADASL